MTAKEMFDKYKTLKHELAVLEMQINNFTGITEDDMIESMVFSGQPDGERVQTSNISDKTAKIALTFRERMKRENEDYYNFLYNRYCELKTEIDFFEGCVKLLGDRNSDIIFELLDGDLTWDMIETHYNISRMTISRIRRDAIKEISRMYDDRERQEAAYMFS